MTMHRALIWAGKPGKGERAAAEVTLDTAAPGWEQTVDAMLAMVKADILNPDAE